MGLFGKLKDAVGIGSLKSEIQLSVPGINAGESIAGTVLLHSSANDQKITSVLLQLVNFGVDVQTTDVITDDYYYGSSWETHEKNFKFQTTLYETYLAHDFTIAKNQRLELPFEITTPPDMYASDKQNRYMLKAHVDIPGQIDSKCAKPVRVLMGGAGPGEEYDDFPPAEGDDMPAIGERVLAFYEDAHYECAVLDIPATGIHVQWDDGTDSVVPYEHVLPSESAMPTVSDLGMNQRVMALYGDGFYEASVGALQGSQIGIRWDDGTETWVGLHEIRLL